MWIRVNNELFARSFQTRACALVKLCDDGSDSDRLIDLIRLQPQASKISTYRLSLDWFRQKSE
jgi:hypothetical protein